MPPKANKRLPQKGKGGRGWRPGGDKTLRTKQTRRGCWRTDAVSEPSHTHTHGPWLSQWWGDNRRFKATVVSWCTVDTRNCYLHHKANSVIIISVAVREKNGTVPSSEPRLQSQPWFYRDRGRAAHTETVPLV